MHMHSVAAGAAGNSLAGAALAAETALATRRAQQLREAGRKLKATSLESGLQFANQIHSEPQLSSPLSPSVTAVEAGGLGTQAAQQSFAQQFAADANLPPPQVQNAEIPPREFQIREISPVPGSAPVSYWA